MSLKIIYNLPEILKSHKKNKNKINIDIQYNKFRCYLLAYFFLLEFF